MDTEYECICFEGYTAVEREQYDYCPGCEGGHCECLACNPDLRPISAGEDTVHIEVFSDGLLRVESIHEDPDGGGCRSVIKAELTPDSLRKLASRLKSVAKTLERSKV